MQVRFLAFVLASSAVVAAPAAPRPAAQAPDPDSVLAAAMAKAGDIPAQAEALTDLAWPREGGDPRVREKAMQKLVEFADRGMDACWKAILKVKPSDQADVVKTLLLEFRQLSAGLPPPYLPALDDAIWFGTREARILAMQEVARFNIQGPILTIIDAAMEDPGVLPTALDVLGQMRDPRARFFLERVFHEGDPEMRGRAAAALSHIGETGRAVLKTATRSEDKETRLAAIRALLPVATVDDLSSLYDYARMHRDDDLSVTEATEATAAKLEKLLEALRAVESASPEPR